MKDPLGIRKLLVETLLFVRLVKLEEGQQPTDLSPEELRRRLVVSDQALSRSPEPVVTIPDEAPGEEAEPALQAVAAEQEHNAIAIDLAYGAKPHDPEFSLFFGVSRPESECLRGRPRFPRILRIIRLDQTNRLLR
jgi:hypothetical protein